MFNILPFKIWIIFSALTFSPDSTEWQWQLSLFKISGHCSWSSTNGLRPPQINVLPTNKSKLQYCLQIIQNYNTAYHILLTKIELKNKVKEHLQNFQRMFLKKFNFFFGRATGEGDVTFSVPPFVTHFRYSWLYMCLCVRACLCIYCLWFSSIKQLILF